MCITKSECWLYDETPYLTEIEAVKSALDDIAAHLLKVYSANMVKGLLDHGEHISSLRARYLELCAIQNQSVERSAKVEPGPGTQPRGTVLYDDLTRTTDAR